MHKTETPLTRGATIYQLTAEERACMKRLTDAGLVVSIGKHAAVKRERAELIEALECLDNIGNVVLPLYRYRGVPDHTVIMGWDHVNLTLGHLRKARALLERMKP